MEYYLLAFPPDCKIFLLVVAQNLSIRSLGMEKNLSIRTLVMEIDLWNQLGRFIEFSLVGRNYRFVHNVDY